MKITKMHIGKLLIKSKIYKLYSKITKLSRGLIMIEWSKSRVRSRILKIY